jgi:hypothetical protein
VLRIKARAGGIQFNEHCDDLPAEIVFRHACKLGFESIVSKRLGSPYRSGRSRDCFGTNPPMRSLPIAPIFIADRASLAVSREKDGKLRLVYADRMTSRSSCLGRRSLAQTDSGPFMTSGPDPYGSSIGTPRNPWLCQARRVGEARHLWL